MIEQTNENVEIVKQFIKDNISKSTFILGNLQNPTQQTYFLNRDENIVGLFNIINNKYISYLFANEISKKEQEKIFEFANKFKHQEGTIVNVEENLISNYYNNIKSNELSVLTLKKNNKYKFSSRVEELKPKYYESYFAGCEQAFNKKIQESDLNELNKYYVIIDDNKVVSTCCLTAISDQTAVVTTVYTVDGYKRQGLAEECIGHMLASNCEVEREIMIFYSNPHAKSLYNKLEFNGNNTLYMFEK